MGQYTSYWLYQKYETRGSQEPIPCYPNTYSVDGDGTMQKIVKIENDVACGYHPEPEVQYRWVNLPESQYVCDECPASITRWQKTDNTICLEVDAQYRWVNMDASTDYYCEGTTKYHKQKKQVSYDGGQTWQDVTPPVYQKGDVAEEQSTDCGYVPPKKFAAIYSDGKTLEVECNSSTELTSGETQPSGYIASAMTSAVIGDCVATIDIGTFYNCRRLIMVNSDVDGVCDIPNSVTTIGALAFMYCFGLTSVNIPNFVTTIGINAFYQCDGLTSVTIGNNVQTIGGYAFMYCKSLTSVNIPNSVTNIGEHAFDECSGLTSVTIGYSVTTIGEGAFEECISLTSVNIPNSVTNIGSYAFNECYSLTGVTIPNNVTSIGNYTFCNCRSLTGVSIPNSVISIGYYAFGDCRSLTGVVIPNSVTTIVRDAFRGCTGLTSITVESITPPTLGVYAFDDTDNCPILVPSQSVSTYKSASGWSQYASRIQPIP